MTYSAWLPVYEDVHSIGNPILQSAGLGKAEGYRFFISAPSYERGSHSNMFRVHIYKDETTANPQSLGCVKWSDAESAMAFCEEWAPEPECKEEKVMVSHIIEDDWRCPYCKKSMRTSVIGLLRLDCKYCGKEMVRFEMPPQI